MFRRVEPIPLVDGLQDTPIDKDAPLAPVRLVRDGQWQVWEVVRCPYCGERHRHGTGECDEDPRQFLGGRYAHCHPHHSTGTFGEYRLVAIEGKITTLELDEHFPMVDGPVKTSRIAFSPEIRDAVWMKSGGHCWYCGVTLLPFTTFTVDHLEAVSIGGSHDLDNLVPCCRTCNSTKGAQSVETFRRRRGGMSFWFER